VEHHYTHYGVPKKLENIIHLIPQVDFIYHNGENVMDFTGRFENIDSDWEHICGILSISDKLPKLNQTIDTDYRQYYTDTTKSIVEELYAKDLELLGYTF